MPRRARWQAPVFVLALAIAGSASAGDAVAEPATGNQRSSAALRSLEYDDRLDRNLSAASLRRSAFARPGTVDGLVEDHRPGNGDVDFDQRRIATAGEKSDGVPPVADVDRVDAFEPGAVDDRSGLAPAELDFGRPGESGSSRADEEQAQSEALEPPESPVAWAIDGLDELSFNPLRGRFELKIDGAGLAADPDSVEVYVNDTRLPSESVRLSRRSVLVDYAFVDGVNEVLVRVPDDQGRTVRADGLFWAGDRTVIVDVVDARQRPPPRSTVATARLGESRAVRVQLPVLAGTVRFDHVPAVDIVIEVFALSGAAGRAVVGPDQGSVLIQLPPIR